MIKTNKVLFLITEDYYYWMHRRNLALYLKSQGWEVHLATRKGELQKEIQKEGIYLHPVDIDRKSFNPFLRLKNIFQIASIYKKVNPDIIHHVSIQSIVLGTYATIISGHRKILNAYTGLGYIFVGEKFSKKILRWMIVQILKLAYKLKKPFSSFENPDDQKTLIDYKILKEEESIVLPGSGVNVNQFFYSPEVEGKLKVLLPARLIYDKGIAEFVEAARILKNKYPQVEFLLAGKLDQSNPTCIPESLLQTWQKENILTWLGEVKDMPSLYHSVHIVVLPSYYREGMPMSLAEACACGRACVTTNTNGCREIIKDGENGFLVPVKDSQNLALAIEKLIINSDLRKEMGRKAREIVVCEFSQEIVFTKVEKIYQKLLSKN